MNIILALSNVVWIIAALMWWRSSREWQKLYRRTRDMLEETTTALEWNNDVLTIPEVQRAAGIALALRKIRKELDGPAMVPAAAPNAADAE